MTAWLRRAGRGTDAAGCIVTWTVAEGRRGRRWREVRTGPNGAVVSSLLFETDPAGRFSHTELATPAGLLTLHPEGDGTIHGNTVTSAGVHHVVGLPWDEDGVVLVEGSVVTDAAAAFARRRAAAPEGGELVVLRIGSDLRCEVGREPEATFDFRADPDGLPILHEAHAWPLE